MLFPCSNHSADSEITFIACTFIQVYVLVNAVPVSDAIPAGISGDLIFLLQIQLIFQEIVCYEEINCGIYDIQSKRSDKECVRHGKPGGYI